MKQYDLEKGNNLYDVTLTHRGSVSVRADSPEQAFEKLNSLSAKDVDEVANLTRWEASDVGIVE